MVVAPVGLTALAGTLIGVVAFVMVIVRCLLRLPVIRVRWALIGPQDNQNVLAS